MAFANAQTNEQANDELAYGTRVCSIFLLLFSYILIDDSGSTG